jgi:hypothetical protein
MRVLGNFTEGYHDTDSRQEDCVSPDSTGLLLNWRPGGRGEQADALETRVRHLASRWSPSSGARSTSVGGSIMCGPD